MKRKTVENILLILFFTLFIFYVGICIYNVHLAEEARKQEVELVKPIQ